MKPYAIIHKQVGETPLEAIEKYRSESGLSTHISLAYAGRLDPMASGKLLVLIGDECKEQSKYHALDKRYRFEVLLGTRSDTGDILGLLTWMRNTNVEQARLEEAAKKLTSNIKLPYPHFSSKTVQGKPLHVWTLEGRLNEIDIPTASTTVYALALRDVRQVSSKEILETIRDKIGKLTPVTEKSKTLGRDFRKTEVLSDWAVWYEYHEKQTLTVATFDCIASSGTYMRSLAEEIGRHCNVPALAYSIHRSEIGQYQPLPLIGGFWKKRF